MTRVVVVDDYPVVREGVKRIIANATGFNVVGEAANGEAALQLVHSTPWDVMIVDMSVPKQNGVELLREIIQEIPGKPLLAFSDKTDVAFAARVLRAGASGFLTKDALVLRQYSAFRRSSGNAFVPMMQPAHFWNLNDAARL